LPRIQLVQQNGANRLANDLNFCIVHYADLKTH